MRYHHQCSSRRRQQATSFMQTCSHSDDSSPSFSYDGLISGTLDSHRLAAWAQPQGKENELVEEVYVCRRIIIIQRCSRRPAVPPSHRPACPSCVRACPVVCQPLCVGDFTLLLLLLLLFFYQFFFEGWQCMNHLYQALSSQERV